jgi:hypothetical protein
MNLNNIAEFLNQKFLSEPFKEKFERTILTVAIISFIIHLVLIALVHFHILDMNQPSNLLQNPIAAIYTPFSFILVYEVYLLIYFLPKSFSNYIAKQYEIVALIIIRRMFKDFSELSLTADWFKNKGDLQSQHKRRFSLLAKLNLLASMSQGLITSLCILSLNIFYSSI